jgi:murein endopeptidase
MRAFALVCVLALTATATTAEARSKRATKHTVEKTKKRTATASPAKREEAPKQKKKRDRSVGAPWSGSLQAPAKLAPGDGYFLRRPWRTYATRTTIDLVREAVKDTLETYPKVHTLAIGDFSQENGGWISEHASHQSGRDVDIGLFYKKKPKGYPAAFIKATKDTLDAAATWRLVSLLARTADDDGGVQMIFLDQALQNVLVAWAKKHEISDSRIAEVQRAFRHIPHHSDHLHVRFKCRERDSSCR